MDLPGSINELSMACNGGSCEHIPHKLVHESKTARIFCNGDQGIKVLIDPSLNADQCQRLLTHEHRVSSSLSSSTHRKVQRLETYQGLPALYFEWVDGETVGDWLRCVSSRGIEERLQVALAITRAVCDFHEVGLFHGQLSVDNVILGFRGEERTCSATLIDYSKSIILADCLYDFRNEKKRVEFFMSGKQKELNDLGVVLYSVFSNQAPNTSSKEDNELSGEDAPNSKRGKNQKVHGTKDLPLYLVSLVSSLLTPVANHGGNDTLQYDNPREVLSDLQLALDNPDSYLKTHRWADLVTQPLLLPLGKFYGRQAELSMVRHAFDVMIEGSSKLCTLVVSGYAGTGKSTLLKQITEPLQQSNGYMIVCKFNQSDPADTVLSSCFDSFFEFILGSSNDDVKGSMKTRIEDTINEHVGTLVESMPHLRVFLGRDDLNESHLEDSQARKSRWRFLLSSLVYAISSREHPIVLVFEDLHWACADTLDIIQLIISDSKIRYCLFCISYRDCTEPTCTDIPERLQSLGVEKMWNIKLGPIERESVGRLISETLCMPPTAIEPLSSVICNKTGGVMLFVTSFLKSLHEEQLIYFNLTTLRWEFDLNKITQKEVSSDILDFLSERIRRMPIKVQAGLRIASCLGSTFGFDVFRRAYKASDEATQEFISFAIGNGLLQEIDPNQYTWSHDQIYEAAYSLIKPDMRETTHLLVGTRIYLTAKDDEIMGLIHDIVRNMNVGMHLIETPEQKTELAQLNFMAGTKSKKSSAFFTASKYFLSGTQLLSDDWPESNYDLGMRLYNSATDMLLITGEWAGSFEETVKKPLEYARNFEDRLPALTDQARFLCSVGRHEEATEKCFSILREYGEDFPAEITPEIMQTEITQTKMLLANFPENNLLRLPQLEDQMKLSLMKHMTATMLMLFHRKSKYVILVGCRIAQRSASYGWSPYSAFGLYSFGQALMSIADEADEGYSWVKVGVSLLKHMNDNHHLPVLEAIYHAFISFWREPLQAVSESLKKTHTDCLLEGHADFACASSMEIIRQGFVSGKNLAELSDDCKSVAKETSQLKQMWSLALVTSLHYAVLNLMGETDLTQPFVFHEEINSEEELFNNGLARGDETLIDTIYLNRLLVAFWSKKYETTVDVAKLRGKTNVMCILDICHVFYEGIAALRVARRENTERDSLIEIGEKALSTFETWKSYSNWNFENKHLLLAAELYYTKGELHAAEKQYKASIESAQAHRFLHEEGLALEELGMLYKEMGNLEQAEIVTLKALSCYERWGATAIVKQLDSELKGWNITEKS